MSTTPNQKDLLAKKSDLEGILKPDDNDVLHLPDVTITLAESGQFYLAGIDKKLLTLIGNTSGNVVTLDGDAGLTFTTSGGSSTITGITSSSGNSTNLAASQSMVSAKQDKIIAGTNIQIAQDGKTISATDTNELENLTDVNITTPTDGQGLVYNNTTQKWENGNVSSASSIDTLTDVNLTNLTNGQILKYNSTSQKWENANESGGGSTTTVSVIPKVLTGTNIADITVGNGNTTDIYDYAYFDGSGYYETPFKVDTDHEYEIIFEANYDATMAVIGTYAGANYFHLTIYNNYWYVGTNSGEVHPSTYTTGKHTFKTDSSHTYLDDTQFTSYTPAVVNNYITIGARQNTYLYKGKFYEFKIKSISTGNVLYDLVPGMRGTTKGLYDLVSDTFVECSFISNMGTKTGTSGGVTTQLYAPSIEANPSGTATDSLSSIEIDGTIYSIEGGGGGGSAMKLTQTEYDALTQEEKENGTIYFVGATTPVEQLIPRVTAADSHITSSSDNGSYSNWCAFNETRSTDLRNPNNVWMPTGTNQWIQYHFDSAYYFNQIFIICFSNYSGDWTGDITIEASNDGVNWTNILASGENSYELTAKLGPVNEGGSGLETEISILLDSSNSWEYIRFFNIDQMNGWYTPSCFIDEIYVYGSSTPIVVEDRDIYYMGDKYTNNSGGGASSHTYSTSEQKIGTWIDGRDMYEKTYYNATGPTLNNPITLDSNITTSNTDLLTCPQYFYTVDGSYINSGSFLETGLTSNGIVVNRNNAPAGLGTITELYTTVRYVKSQPRNVSLLHFEGDLTDECGIGWHINGGPAISTEQAKFGSSSLKFSDGFVYSDITPVFKFGNNDFTIDAWLYPLAATRQAFFAIAPYNGGDYRLGIDMWQQGSSANQWMSSTGSGWNVTNADGGGNGIGHIALSTGTWQHIALVRHETSFTLYINGQVAVTNNIGTAGVYWGSSDVFKLGTWGNNRYNYYGYIDEFRVANYAVWTDTFTPPTQPYT